MLLKAQLDKLLLKIYYYAVCVYCVGAILKDAALVLSLLPTSYKLEQSSQAGFYTFWAREIIAGIIVYGTFFIANWRFAKKIELNKKKSKKEAS